MRELMTKFTCNRCGAETYMETADAFLPSGWLTAEIHYDSKTRLHRRTIHLCSKCTDHYREFLDNMKEW